MLWVSEVEFCPAWKCCKLLTNTCRQNLSKHYMKGGLNIKTNNILLRNFPAHHLIWTLIKLLKMFCFKQGWYNFFIQLHCFHKQYLCYNFLYKPANTHSINIPSLIPLPSIYYKSPGSAREKRKFRFLVVIGWLTQILFPHWLSRPATCWPNH